MSSRGAKRRGICSSKARAQMHADCAEDRREKSDYDPLKKGASLFRSISVHLRSSAKICVPAFRPVREASTADRSVAEPALSVANGLPQDDKGADPSLRSGCRSATNSEMSVRLVLA